MSSKKELGEKGSSSGPLRVMSGIRTTGRLHIGHYFGAIKNWIQLQEQHLCFFGAMDWHGMTDGYKTPGDIPHYTRDTIAEMIAWGIDPRRSVVFVQSHVPAHLELFMIFANLTPMGWLERVNTWKDAEEELKAKDAYNLGRFGYPVLQTADIAIYQGHLVPVGKDQVPHIELARDIIGRFNHLYGKGSEVLPLPRPVLSETPVLPGSDGRKMSKSYDNYIPLTEEVRDREQRMKKMPTDPARVRRHDPGNPEKCPVYSLHRLFSTDADLAWVNQGCTTAGIGCGDCKGRLLLNMNALQEPRLQKKKELLKDPQTLDQIINEGCNKATQYASETLKKVRTAMQSVGGSL